MDFMVELIMETYKFPLGISIIMKTLFYNGTFYLDSSGSKRAGWILVEDGIIREYGLGEAPSFNVDKKVDLKGLYGYPGFSDCHIHLIKYGLSLWWIDLRGTKSLEEFKERIRRGLDRDFHGWILGRGWDQDKFVEKRYPTRYDLDEVSSDKPIFLRRVCGHIAVVNSKALELAGIDKDTPDPEGGIIDRDEEGEPTGILRETAMNLVKDVIPKPTVDDYKKAALEAMEDLFRRGVTFTHLVSAEPEEWIALKSLKDEGRLKIRVRVYFDYTYMDWIEMKGLKFGEGDDMLRFMGIKIITDGSLGGRTAAMMEDYSDDPGNRGVLIIPFEKLVEIVNRAFANGFQLAIHGIGDLANKNIVEVYKEMYRRYGNRDRRDRIEHASILNDNIIEDMADHGIIASVQPQFVTSDTWTVDRVGLSRAKYAYPFKTLLEKGVLMGAGSDAPVEIPDPIYGIYSAVTRGVYEENPLGRATEDEKISVADAIRIYTEDAAKLSYDEGHLGRLDKGYYMDMVVLDRDLFNIGDREIKDAKVVLTVVNGEVVYSMD